jgi:hypothetical protein
LQTEANFDPSFVFEHRGPIQMKGKAEPMNVYYLTRKQGGQQLDSPNNFPEESLSTLTVASSEAKDHGDGEVSDVDVAISTTEQSKAKADAAP